MKLTRSWFALYYLHSSEILNNVDDKILTITLCKPLLTTMCSSRSCSTLVFFVLVI